jgi:transposase
MAPLPVRIIAKSLVSDRIIVYTIVGKYTDHNPLFRQRVIFLRDAGIDISRATIGRACKKPGCAGFVPSMQTVMAWVDLTNR